MEMSTDFYLWTQKQAAVLQDHDTAGLDWSGLSDEIRDMGEALRSAIWSQMKRILEHKIKLQFFFNAECAQGWETSIENAQNEIEDIVERNPSLHGYPVSILEECYASAGRRVERKFGKAPKQCPWTVEEVLGQQ